MEKASHCGETDVQINKHVHKEYKEHKEPLILLQSRVIPHHDFSRLLLSEDEAENVQVWPSQQTQEQRVLGL